MKRTKELTRLYRSFIPLALLTCGALLLASSRPSWGNGNPAGAQQEGSHKGTRLGAPQQQDIKPEGPEITTRQKRDLLKSNFEKTKDNASELADMAIGLRDELNKTNVNILSVDVIHRAEKIEKLAKKIREEAKGY